MTRKQGILNILIYFFSMIVFGIILALFFGVESIETSFGYFGSLMLLSGIPIIIYDRKFIKNQFIENFKKKETYVTGGIGVLVIIVLTQVLTVFFMLIYPELDLMPENQAVIDDMITGVPLFASIPIIALVVPFIEELIFRAAVVGLLIGKRVSKSYIPYILAAFLFTIMHDTSIFLDPTNMQNLYFFSIYFILALVFSVFYKRTNHNLLAVFFMHFINNLLSLLPW